MNILQLSSSRGFFGAESVILQLSMGLKRMENVYPTIVILERENEINLDFKKRCEENGIETVVLKCEGRIDFRSLNCLRKLVKRNEIKIIHSHGYKANLYSNLTSWGMSNIKVATCHNWLGNSAKMRLYKKVDLLSLRRFDKVIAVSDTIKEIILKSGIRREKVAKIRNGIFLEPFEKKMSKTDGKRRLGLTDNAVVIGTVGRISEEKGHRYLLDIAGSIIHKFPESIFLIVGDGPLRDELARKYRHPSIIFTGIRNDLPQLYFAMDIFTLPSMTEGLPMALLEAMAANLPVIASRVGEIPEVIDNGKDGILIDPGDSAGLRQSILRLMTQKEERCRFGINAHKKIKEQYSSERMASEYMDEYSKLIS